MKKYLFGLIPLIIIFSFFNLFAGNTGDYNPLYFSFGFGNFGPNHQLTDESASYQEFQLKYYPQYLDHSQFCLGGGLILNRESGKSSFMGETKLPYEVTSKLNYFFLEYDASSDYYGIHIGALYFNREKGYYDEGPEQYLKPSVGIKIGMMNKIYVFGELANDLIYKALFKMPILYGITVLVSEVIDTIQLGYFKIEDNSGFELKLQFSFSDRIVGYGQGVLQSEYRTYSIRIGFGYKI